MIAVVCVDDRGGMLFNHRRQSRDRAVRADLLKESGGSALWMNAYSAKQFQPLPPNVQVAEDFLSQAGPGELCFVEDQDLRGRDEQLEGVILYRWNRTYPADMYFTLPLDRWTRKRHEEFAGSSHERITKEVYGG